MGLAIATLIQNVVVENGVAVAPFFCFLKSISAGGGHYKKANVDARGHCPWA